MKFGVSLYSYQTAIENGKMDLEACLREIQTLPGTVDGVEALMRRTDIPQAAYKGLLGEAEQARFRELLAQYGMVPTCYDSIAMQPGFNHRLGLKRFTNPSKTIYDEQMQILKSEIDFAASFGFHIMRAPNVYGFYEEVIRDSLLYALDKQVQLCAEVHAPMTIDGDIAAPYLEMVDRTCPEAGGIIPDFGIFSHALPRGSVRMALAHGADPQAVERIEAAWKAGEDLMALEAEFAGRADFEPLQALLLKARFTVWDDPQNLLPHARYIRHVHVKFYEVDEQYIEHGIDFPAALRALIDCGYDGYLSTEYEGHNFNPDDDPYEREQVRRQITMTRSLLESLQTK